MSYAEELFQTARALNELAVLGTETLTDLEVDIALLGRGAVLDLLSEVHDHITGIKVTARPTLDRLERHPVAAFGQALRTSRRISPSRAPTDLLAEPAPSPVGQAWQRVARHALAARHVWVSAPRPTPDADRAWTAIADLAAIGSVLSELDHELGTAAASHPHREWEAGRLVEAAGSGLRLAAREAATIAADGPLPSTGPDTLPPPNRSIIKVDSPQTFVAAQQQLGALLRTAKHLRPESLHLIGSAHVRACLAVLDCLPPETDLGPLHQALDEHTRLLATATTRRWAVASLEPGDPFPTWQGIELTYSVTRRPELLSGLTRSPVGLQRLVSALADTTVALAETADAHLQAGTWLVQTRGAMELRWVHSNAWHDVPEPFQTLRTAAFQAPRLRGLTPAASGDDVTQPALSERAVAARPPRPQAWPDSVPAVRHLLAPAPFHPLRTGWQVARPEHPSVPPRPIAPPSRRQHQRR